MTRRQLITSLSVLPFVSDLFRCLNVVDVVKGSAPAPVVFIPHNEAVLKVLEHFEEEHQNRRG